MDTKKDRNPSERTHIFFKQVDPVRRRFAGYAYNGKVRDNGKDHNVHTWTKKRKLILEDLEI